MTDDQVARLAWLRLNVDGVLIAILGLIMASDVLQPQTEEYVQVLGHVPNTFYLWSTMYAASSVLMMVGFVNNKVGPELAGRLLLALGLALETLRSMYILGITQGTVTLAVATVAVTIVGFVRASVLLTRDGLAVVIPSKDAK